MPIELWLILFGGLITLGFFAGIFIDLIKNKDKYKAEVYEAEEKILADEGEIITVHAEVVDMSCGVNTVGYQAYKQPKAVKHFIITFKCDDGEIRHVNLSEEMYDGFDIGLVGVLTLVDGQLSSFEPNENA